MFQPLIFRCVGPLEPLDSTPGRWIGWAGGELLCPKCRAHFQGWELEQKNQPSNWWFSRWWQLNYFWNFHPEIWGRLQGEWNLHTPNWVVETQLFFWNFHPYLGEDEPNLTSIFFRWVETTNQFLICHLNFGKTTNFWWSYWCVWCVLKVEFYI